MDMDKDRLFADVSKSDWHGEPMTFRTGVPESLLTLSGAMSEPVVEIKSDGRVFWKGREVETDAQFVEAVRAVVQRLWPVLVVPASAEVDIDGRC